MLHNYLQQLHEVVLFSPGHATKFFTKSYKKYSHLGKNIKFKGPIKVPLSYIIKEDSERKNKGRPWAHTPLELQNIANNLSNGIKPYLDLPIIVRNDDPDVEAPFKLIAGFGYLNGLITNGITEFWFYEILGATPSQLDEISVYENTSEICDSKYWTGEKGIEHYLKLQIAKKHKDLINTEDSIIKYVKRVWPGMHSEVRGRIISRAINSRTKARAFTSYNPAGVKNWLDETADKTSKFVYGGELDSERDKYGFICANVQDPILRAAAKYVETDKSSYVVLHTKVPGKNKTIKQMRGNLVKQFNKMLDMFKSLGVKKTNFIEILGFMPQDTKNEKQNFLVDVNGKPIKD